MMEEDAAAEPAGESRFIEAPAEVTLLEAIELQADGGFLMTEHVEEGIGMIEGIGRGLVLVLVIVLVITVIVRADEKDISGRER